MRVVVREGPTPIVTPKDMPGGHDENDPFLTAAIAAVQAEIDGPSGWLGRALGPQTLELVSENWPSSLPYRPAIEVLSVSVDGVPVEGVTTEWDGLLVMPYGLPRGEVRIIWRAGYEAGKTGDVPANAKAAVMLMAQDLMAQSHASGGLRSVTVDDVITEAFNSPEMVQRARSVTVDRLLSPLRLYRL